MLVLLTHYHYDTVGLRKNLRGSRKVWSSAFTRSGEGAVRLGAGTALKAKLQTPTAEVSAWGEPAFGLWILRVVWNL